MGAVVPHLCFSFRMIWPSPIFAGNVACWQVPAESFPWIPPQPKVAASSKHMPPHWGWLASPVWTNSAGTPQFHSILGSAEVFAEALWPLKCFLLPSPAFLPSHRCSCHYSSVDVMPADVHLRGCFLGKLTCSLSHISLKISPESVLICILDAIIPHSSTLFPHFISK